MATWLIVTLAVYAAIVLGFTVAMIREAPKHGSKFQVTHLGVAIFWPLWGLWYLFAVLDDKRRAYLERKK